MNFSNKIVMVMCIITIALTILVGCSKEEIKKESLNDSKVTNKTIESKLKEPSVKNNIEKGNLKNVVQFNTKKELEISNYNIIYSYEHDINLDGTKDKLDIIRPVGTFAAGNIAYITDGKTSNLLTWFDLDKMMFYRLESIKDFTGDGILDIKFFADDNGNYGEYYTYVYEDGEYKFKYTELMEEYEKSEESGSVSNDEVIVYEDDYNLDDSKDDFTAEKARDILINKYGEPPEGYVYEAIDSLNYDNGIKYFSIMVGPENACADNFKVYENGDIVISEFGDEEF